MATLNNCKKCGKYAPCDGFENAADISKPTIWVCQACQDEFEINTGVNLKQVAVRSQPSKVM